MQTASSAPRKAVRRAGVATVSSRSFFRLSSMGEMYSVSVSSSSGCDCSSGAVASVCAGCSSFTPSTTVSAAGSSVAAASLGASRISRISCGSFTVPTVSTDCSAISVFSGSHSVSTSDGASRTSRISCGSFLLSTDFSGSFFSTTDASVCGSIAAFTVCDELSRSMGST